MISFYCPSCGAEFEVEDSLSGAWVACSVCDEHFHVPAASFSESNEKPEETSASRENKLDVSAELAEFVNSQPNAEPNTEGSRPSKDPLAERSKLSPRQRRLTNDFRMMQELFSDFPLIHLERVQGNPPETYVVSYHIRGIERVTGEKVV